VIDKRQDGPEPRSVERHWSGPLRLEPGGPLWHQVPDGRMSLLADQSLLAWEG